MRTYGQALQVKARAGQDRDMVSRVLLVLVVILMVAAASGTVWLMLKYENSKYAQVERLADEISHVADTWPDEDVELPDGPGMESGRLFSTDPMDRELNWDGILGINEAVGCWLYIPDTPIDYAVMHEAYTASGKDYFYLRHDIYGASSSSGWIFSVDPPGEEKDMHRLVFGHNMGRNSTIMFGTLQDYKEKEFGESHKYVYLYYPDRVERWAVWSACNVSSSHNVYVMPYTSGSRDYADLLLTLDESALYDLGVPVPLSDEEILVLSTCDRGFGGDTGRFIVACVLDEVKEYETEGGDTEDAPQSQW